MSLSNDQLVEELSKKTVLEIAELVKLKPWLWQQCHRRQTQMRLYL